jgi:hypothetical protein
VTTYAGYSRRGHVLTTHDRACAELLARQLPGGRVVPIRRQPTTGERLLAMAA